jgi:hypothetical protein
MPVAGSAAPPQQHRLHQRSCLRIHHGHA